MSAPIFQQDILFFQRLLAGAGLYTGKLDGDYGPMTANAEAAFDRLSADAIAKYGIFDPRSEAVIATLVPKAQIAARKFMSTAKGAPFTVKLLSGTRTYAKQDNLYHRIPKVTNARGGQSWHNFGLAWDAGIFKEGVYYTGKNTVENAAYVSLAALIKAAIPEIEWGGDWVSFKDAPHYQLKTGKTISQTRALFEEGKPYV